MVTVSGYWKSFDGSATYGYCSCGREVKHLGKIFDTKCPLCGAKIEWKFDDKSLWISGRKS